MALRKIDEGLWAFEQVLKVGGMRFPARTALVRLGDGGLVVFSAVPGLQGEKVEVDALGPVRAFVQPCLMHHLGLEDVGPSWPGARRFARPSLQAKRPELAFTDALGDSPDPLWAKELDQVVVGGMPRLDEVVFFHRPSRSVLLSDLCFNVVQSDHALTRFIMRLNGAYGRFGPSRICRSLMADKAQVRAAVDRILAWEPERILVCHGEVVEHGGRAELERAFAFLPAATRRP